MLKLVVLLCLIRRWFQRYYLSKNMILLILWRLLLIISVFRCLCFFVSLSKAKKKILLLLSWDFRFQNHLMSSSLRFFSMSFSLRFFFMLCLLSRLFWMSFLLRLAFSSRSRTIIAILSLFVDLVFFRKSLKRNFTSHFIFQLI